MPHGTRWDAISVEERLGAGAKGQSVDQTLTATALAGYAPDGLTLTKAAIAVADILTSPGGGTGATIGGLGSPYEQIPVGSKDGVNTSFFLDYIPASPPTGTPPVVPFWLFINGSAQSPYTPRYSLAAGSNHLVMAVAPKATDEFWCVYFRGPAAPPPSPIASAVLTMVYTYTHSATTDGFVKLQQGSSLPLLYDNTAYTNRTFTTTLSPLPAGFGSGLWTVSLEVYNSLFQDGTDTLQLFELYADVTYADTTTARIYPTAAAYGGTAGGGDFLYVTQASGDGTHVTYTVQAWGHAAVNPGDVLDVSGFTTAGFNVTGATVVSSTIAGGVVGGEDGTLVIANATTGTETITVPSGAFNGYAGSPQFYGSVADIANALDGNLSTYATITRDHYYPGRSGGGVNFTF